MPPHRAPFCAPEDHGWCEGNAEGLLVEVEAELEEPLVDERYERYFGSGLGNDRPPRTGYFLSHALVRRHLERNPGLAEAVRLPAEQLLGWRCPRRDAPHVGRTDTL